MVGKVGAILLLVFVIFIFFINWYFVFRHPCKPITECDLNSLNISCASTNDCLRSSIQGDCNMKTFKCENLILTGSEEDCKKAGGEWVNKGCVN